MGDYTQFLSQKGNSISPEDENYIQELLEIASSFRTFDAALDEFIVQKAIPATLQTRMPKSGLSSVNLMRRASR